MKILIPTNFSGHGVIAAQYAIELFKDSANEFILENVYQAPKGSAGTLVSIHDIISREVNEELKKELELIKSQYKDANVDFQFEEGSPANTIKTTLKRNHFDLLVIGHNAHLKRFHKTFIEQPEYWPVMLVPGIPFSEKASDAIVISGDKIDSSVTASAFKSLNKRYKGKSHHLQLRTNGNGIEQLKGEIQSLRNKYNIGIVILNVSAGCKLEFAIKEHKLDDIFLTLPSLLVSYQ